MNDEQRCQDVSPVNLRCDQCLIPEDLGILLPLPMSSLAMLLRCRLVNASAKRQKNLPRLEGLFMKKAH